MYILNGLDVFNKVAVQHLVAECPCHCVSLAKLLGSFYI